MEDSLNITFTGDIALSKYYADAKVPDLVFSGKIKDFLGDSDACLFNIETAIGERKKVFQFSHVSSEEIFNLLNSLCPPERQIWNLANNHVMDIGNRGLENTILWSQKMRSHTIGAGGNMREASRPHYLCKNGIHVGVFSCGSPEEVCGCKVANENSPGVFSWNDIDLIKERIEDIKKICRWCVVVVHCVNEFYGVPVPAIRDKIHNVLSLGADVIVCHHPHVVQGYEFYDNGNKAVFYSLGNFVFDTDYQRSQRNTQIGCLLKINFYKDHFDFSHLGVKIGAGPNGPIEACEIIPNFQEYTETTYLHLYKSSAWNSLLTDYRKRKFLYSTRKRFLFPSLLAFLAICYNISRKRICWKLLKAALFNNHNS